MPPRHLNDAKYWRDRAIELRMVADGYLDKTARRHFFAWPTTTRKWPIAPRIEPNAKSISRCRPSSQRQRSISAIRTRHVTLGVRPRLKRKHANNDGGRKWVANRGATSARLNYVSFDASKEHRRPRRKRDCGRQSLKRRRYSALAGRMISERIGIFDLPTPI
jgi:hypothetical protein